MICHVISASVALGRAAKTSWIRAFQSPISCCRTLKTMVGLLVAPVAPCSMAYLSSPTAHESFQKSVGVVETILCSGLRNMLAIPLVEHTFYKMQEVEYLF